jgi:hypothetical protein
MAEGPFVPAELAEMLRAGRITQQTRLRPMGRESWIPAFKVLEGTPDLTLISSDTPSPEPAVAPVVAPAITPVGAIAAGFEPLPAAFHPHAPAAALVAGLVGMLAWALPIMGYVITIYGGYQGLRVLRTGSRDFRALAGTFLCCVGLVLTFANSVLGIYLRLTR